MRSSSSVASGTRSPRSFASPRRTPCASGCSGRRCWRSTAPDASRRHWSSSRLSAGGWTRSSGSSPAPTYGSYSGGSCSRILPSRSRADTDSSRGLPEPPNPLIGRDDELEALAALLERRDARLLVLTGAGGSGKTRLALEAARRAAASYANGVVLVELAPLRDPELVVPTIAQAVGIADVPQPLEALAEALRSQELLLLLDNAEHVQEATPAFVGLLARAPRLTILVTSRTVLHLTGEHVFPVAPLEIGAAQTLFEQRARALQPGFRVTRGRSRDGSRALPARRRAPAGGRARRRARPRPAPAGRPRPADRATELPRRRPSRPAGAAADALRDPRLELRPALRRGARAPGRIVRVPGWSDAGGRRRGLPRR